MAPALILGFLVLCSCCVPLLSAKDCPSSFECGSFGTMYFPFTNTTNPECGLYLSGCDDPADSAVELRLRNGHNATTTTTAATTTTTTTSLQVKSIATSIPTSTIIVHDAGLQELLGGLGVTVCNRQDLRNIILPPASPLMSFQKEFHGTMTLHACGFEDTMCYSDDELVQYYADSPTRASNECTTFQIPAKLSDAKNTSSSFQENTTSSSTTPSSPSPSSSTSSTSWSSSTISTSSSSSSSSYSAEYTIRVTLSKDCGNCMSQRGGRCGLDHKGTFRCIIQDASSPDDDRHDFSDVPKKKDQGHEFQTVLTVATASAAALIAMLMILRCCFSRPLASIFFWKGENPTEKEIEMFLKRHELNITKRYTFSEIREMTNSFKDKLGKGGFGIVYKGKLPDGRLVAVKVLSKLKGNGEEFINEVATISQTSHVNVVSLYGFCFQGSKRALVYEFMPNGSLEKFIYEDNAATVDRQLDCKTLHDIAIGSARGLEYLHRGCNTRILHFDIKPHNILLDVDFCPKIADFGLAKICPRKESIVSMKGTRGTAGYIAPEVFSRNFGGVSHKSDVYSFGMMILKMVEGRKNINVEVECSSEIYFPQWIYESLEKKQELALRCIKNENDNEMVRKMILVSLWCIQTDPSSRPAMSQVVDMLEGSLECCKYHRNLSSFSQEHRQPMA